MTRIQDRDIKLLRAISRYGILASEHIGHICFNGVSRETMHRRLRKLEDLDVILRATGLRYGKCGWYLSKLGAVLINEEEPIQYRNKNCLLHELKLTDLRLALESMGLAASCTTEMELRRSCRDDGNWLNSESLIPDALIVESWKGKPSVIAIELELNAKSHKRYRKIFSEYASKSNIHFVWYVLGKDSIATPILSQWKKATRLSNSPTLLLSKLDDVLTNRANALVVDDQKERTSIGSGFNKKVLTAESVERSQSAPWVSSQSGASVSTLKNKTKQNKRGLKESHQGANGALSTVDPSPSTIQHISVCGG